MVDDASGDPTMVDVSTPVGESGMMMDSKGIKGAKLGKSGVMTKGGKMLESKGDMTSGKGDMAVDETGNEGDSKGDIKGMWNKGNDGDSKGMWGKGNEDDTKGIWGKGKEGDSKG